MNGPRDKLLDAKSFRVLPGAGWCLALLALLVVAGVMDWPVVNALRGNPELVEHVRFNSIGWLAMKQFGEWYIAAIVGVMLALFHPWKWRAFVVLALAVVFSALLTALLKWAVGRTRPVVIGADPWVFDFFRGGVAGLFDQRNLAFPSGHATSAAAIAATLTLLLPRWAWLWWPFAMLTGVQRILTLAHHPSDVAGAIIVGVIGFRGALWFCLVVSKQKPIDLIPEMPAFVIEWVSQSLGLPSRSRTQRRQDDVAK